MAKILNRYMVDPRDTIINEEFLKEIAELTSDLTEDLRDDNLPKDSGIFEWDENFVDQVIKDVNGKVNKMLLASDRREASKAELKDIQGELRSYISDSLTAPSFSGELYLANNETLSPTLSLFRGNLFVVEGGIVSAQIMKSDSDRKEVTTAAFYVDLVIEVVSLITSAIGLRVKVPSGARSKLKDVIKKFLRTPKGKKAFEKLIKAIKNKNWDLFFKIIHGTELSSLIGEFFAHMFADMGWKDYFITILQLLAFIAMMALSGGAALAAKLVAVALDLLGLGLKIKHAYEHGL